MGSDGAGMLPSAQVKSQVKAVVWWGSTGAAPSEALDVSLGLTGACFQQQPAHLECLPVALIDALQDVAELGIPAHSFEDFAQAGQAHLAPPGKPSADSGLHVLPAAGVPVSLHQCGLTPTFPLSNTSASPSPEDICTIMCA